MGQDFLDRQYSFPPGVPELRTMILTGVPVGTVVIKLDVNSEYDAYAWKYMFFGEKNQISRLVSI